MIGKVYDFNGFAGEIVTDDMQYPFNINNVYDEIQNDDLVSFVVDFYDFAGERVKFAKNIRKYELDKEKTKNIQNEK